MSIAASLDISWSRPQATLPIVHCLLQKGWCFDDHGQTTWLPIGVCDFGDWQSGTVDEAALLKIVSRKDALGEPAGIVLTWQSSQVGGQFLFFDPKQLSINLNINRMEIQSGLTDASWYFQRILQPLHKAGITAESFQFKQA